ncbi:MAG: hypothetical protein R2879_07735 [Saprospiraceae bacterium]
MNPLEEQIKIIRNRALEENQLPPEDFEQRKVEMEKWRKKVGWTQ